MADMRKQFLCGITALALTAGAFAQTAPTATLTVDATVRKHAVSPMLYGLMTEEINHSYEGGLYAELLKNRTFRSDWAGVEAWGLAMHGTGHASMAQDADHGPTEAIKSSLKLTVDRADAKNLAGISNSGWWGIPVRANTVYRGSLWAKGDVSALVARLVSDDSGRTLAETRVVLNGSEWKQYAFTLKTAQVESPSARNHFELLSAQAGTVSLQLVSLMPPTYANRANGLRPDLMERMAAMHPKFLRLPGGNYVEGDHLADWYNWRETIGPLADRPGHQAPWSYWSTDGLGLLEFLEWCEDLRMEPVLAVYAGYALKHEHVEGKALEPFVQEALDEVEYVTGDVSTKWGARRAQDGHPAPFPLHSVEIGNEDWLDPSGSYEKRYPPFAEAFRKRYPALKLIATTTVKSGNYDVLDDHYYRTPAEMFALATRYDATSRSAEKIFVGEWATRSGAVTPNFGDALGDAAFMTGLERNSDVVVMAAYAPLLVNLNPGGMQWATDLIGFTADKTVASPSYWAQVMFARSLGDSVVQCELKNADARTFVSATRDAHTLFLKIVNASDWAQTLALDLKGAAATAKVTTLRGATYRATNSLAQPEFIKPATHSETLGKTLVIAPLTIEVLEVPLR